MSRDCNNYVQKHIKMCWESLSLWFQKDTSLRAYDFATDVTSAQIHWTTARNFMKIIVRCYTVCCLFYAARTPHNNTVPQWATLHCVFIMPRRARHTHLQLVDGKFLISGYGLISLEAERLTPFLCLGDKTLLQNATRNTSLSLKFCHYIRLQNSN